MIYTNSDGGARGNPGPGAIGVIVREDDKILLKHSQKIGNYLTNNIAEYESLIKALELALKFTDKELTCILDSELIVNQLLGEYPVSDPKLLDFFLHVQRLQETFHQIIYKHVLREDKYQILVDEMLNDTLDRELGVKRSRYRRVYS